MTWRQIAIFGLGCFLTCCFVGVGIWATLHEVGAYGTWFIGAIVTAAATAATIICND